MPMQDSTALVLEQAFTAHHAEALHGSSRLTAAMDNIAEQTKILYLEEKFKIGSREAMAQQRLDSDKLAQSILQQRSAQDQPQVGVTGTAK